MGDSTLHEIAPGLYEIGAPPFPASAPSLHAVWSYFVLATLPSPPVSSPLTLEGTWIGPEWNGWYVFLGAPVADPGAFAAAARASLPPPDGPPPDWRSLVWLTSDAPLAVSNDIAMPLMDPSAGTRTFMGGTSEMFEWGPFGIQIGDAPTITCAGGAFAMTGSAGLNALVTLCYGGTAQTQGFVPYGDQWSVVVPAALPGAGGFQFAIAIDPGNLTANLSCGLRYFYPSASGVTGLYYTFAPPAPRNTNPQSFLGFQAALHPLFTDDPAWSSLVLDASDQDPNPYQQNSLALRFPYFATTDGRAITLAADGAAAASLVFCTAPAAGSPDATTLYLTWAGTFRVDAIGAAGDSGPASWMCGLSAQEHLEVRPGDRVGLVPGLPAYAARFASDGSPGSPGSPAAGERALTGRYTTSWVQFPLAPASASDAPARSYFGQPSASVYYAPTDPAYHTPVSSLMATLQAPVVFPMVPYAGAYASQGGSPQVPPFNVGTPPSAFASLEAVALSSERHAAVTAHSPGPIFLRSAASLAHALAEDAAPGWTSLTPQGFVVDLDASGNWQRLTLARDPLPGTPPRFLSFDAPPGGTVSTAVANAVLQDQLFLVVSDPAQLGPFQNQLMLDGFHFEIDIADAVDTVLVFKFNSSVSLRELVHSPSLWAARDAFVSDLPTTQERLLAALAAADVGSPTASPGSGPFAYFREIAESPSWTGILAFDCVIDGNGMPEDLQILLGGIDGRLRAHHLGIERSRVGTTNGVSQIEESSLFGVILYPPPSAPDATTVATTAPAGAPDLDYEVLRLLVVFANSTITVFSVDVGLTVNRLFGRETELAGPIPHSPSANVLVMPGTYQHQGQGPQAVGVVLFGVQPTVFAYPVPGGATRVLESLSIRNGSLTPVSSTVGTPGGTHVVARFALGGTLQFRPAPFPSAAELDLFSYDALPFTDLTIEMAFDLDDEGALVPGSRSLTVLPSLLRPTSEGASLRQGSLMGSIPLQISGFLSSDDGLKASSLGALAVHSLQLEGRAGAPASPGSPTSVLDQAAPPTAYPYVTTAPQHALQFDLPLGSLGALSDVASLTAKLILGWGPSGVIPGADAAAVLVQLPALSAGYGSFNLQGFLQTTFGDANLLRVELPRGPVYAILFNNIKLSVLGFSFPPGVVVDFLLFAGQPDAESLAAAGTSGSNIAWYLSAQKA